ncbi:TadE family type IV pilus minor pilin, partial [Streptomyces sp. NPDC056540]|uniref:TadE family type IV pilus minor pilin n=1 Tax=Streptomyces sp. NPDC056540 TaxID=3345859 RepID=UPI0036C52099
MTAEAALVIPALVLFAALLVWALMAAAAQIRCVDAARAGGFGLLATMSANEGFLLPAAALFLLGAGGGVAMPSAIAALMGEVPEEQAGVGSALNDTI